MYESAAYDKPNDDGFPPDPVAIVVATGTHDVSRLVNLLNGGQPLTEQRALGGRLAGQVRRHNAGRAALRLLAAHGGPDLLVDPLADVLAWAAEEYRRCIVAARATCNDDHYAKCNGRAEAYRQLADRLATAAGLPAVDWDAIKEAVPADGIYRQT